MSSWRTTYQAPSKSQKAKLTVEPSRFAFAQMEALKSTESLDLSLTTDVASVLSKFNVDISDLVAVIEDTTGDISFEELTDLGLDQNREKLVATYRVKKPSGFSGGFCSSGSTEYVAFWADWNDTCEWDYLGTVKVSAYDFEELPDGGLCYTAALQLTSTSSRRSARIPRSHESGPCCRGQRHHRQRTRTRSPPGETDSTATCWCRAKKARLAS